MNRVLAVRGQVVPGDGDAARRSTRALDDGSELERPVADHADAPASSGSGSRPRTCQRDRDALARDRRGRAHRARPRQPVHEHAARHCSCPGSARRSTRRRRVARLRLQRRDPAWRDRRASTSPTISRRSGRTRRRALRRRRARQTTGSTRAPPAGWRAQPVALRWPPRRGRARAAAARASTTLVDPTNAHHHDPTRLAAALMRPGSARAGIRRRRRGRPRRPHGLTADDRLAPIATSSRRCARSSRPIDPARRLRPECRDRGPRPATGHARGDRRACG